jgi:spore maturation protein CgeB/GT2 family glycosyltransferase
VAQAGQNPLEHYFSYGAAEGRDPHPLFDSDWYLKENPDVSQGGVNPLEHYCSFGAAEGRDPHPLFDSELYLKEHPEVANARLNPLVHFVVYGEADLNKLRPLKGEYKFLRNPSVPPSNKSEHVFIQSKLVDTIKALASVIILNRDGENHLERFFSSFLNHHDHRIADFVVVDHDSKDRSLEVIERYMDLLPIKLVKFTQNNSFAFSNNFAVRYASSEVLIFSNNDIIFDRPVISELVSELDDPNIGIVGLPLFYADDSGSNSGKLQHAGIGFQRDDQYDFIRPVNRQVVPLDGQFEREQLAVTAALLSCRKTDFEQAGKFDEGYNYGYEDVDLCLTFRKQLKKSVLLTDKTSAIHDESASQRRDSPQLLTSRRLANIKLFKKRYGRYLEEKFQGSKPANAPNRRQPFRVGLVVTDDDPGTKAGDFFTATELASALNSEFGWECIFLSRLSKTRDWFDVSGLDLLIVLIDKYDISSIQGGSAALIKVAWLRNWFERWVGHPWFAGYDLYLCSSEIARDYVSKETGNEAHVLKIATNPDRFSVKNVPDENYASDYCFTGSYWNSPRDIEGLDPRNLPFEFALYGEGWAGHTQFADSYRGSVPYEAIASVYAGTKILLDDANHVTKPWASVNSRVFDALASGILVITNGDLGAMETFGELLPTYRSIEELEEKLAYFMKHPGEREALAKQLHELVLDKHTYQKRAHELREILLLEARRRKRIAIKIPVPRIEEVNEWGDFHLGNGLAEALRSLGYVVRLDIMPYWYSEPGVPDDVVITIRGLSRYKPSDRHVNLMWQISHPDKVEDEEYEQYDHIFVASEPYAEILSHRISTKVSALLQCTDPERVKYSPIVDRSNDVVFIVNSRKQLRPIVGDAIKAGLNLSVYGTRWEGLIDEKYIAGQHINNEDLGEFYASSGVVLNDHWDTMKANGFISNRLFDAAACGAVIVSDEVEGINEVFDGLVYVYSNGSQELRDCVKPALAEDASYRNRREQLARKIAAEHSFDARALKIDSILQKLVVFSKRKLNFRAAIQTETSVIKGIEN